jgi:hypothetical protein
LYYFQHYLIKEVSYSQNCVTTETKKGGIGMKKIFGVCFLFMALAAATLLITEPLIGISGNAYAKSKKGFTDSFRLEECDGLSTTGRNTFFVLEPGYQLVLEGSEGKGRKEQLVLQLSME